MTDGPLRRLFWRVADALDYLLTLARLHILDALAGPEPATPADQQRARDREQIDGKGNGRLQASPSQRGSDAFLTLPGVKYC
jgi:hypothetical protein